MFPTQDTEVPPGIGHARTSALVSWTFWKWPVQDPQENMFSISFVRKRVFPRKQFLKIGQRPLVNYTCINPWKHTRTVIPNAQISLGRVTEYSSEITISGASQFHVPPRGVSTVMLNEEEVRYELPKWVKSARPSGEISTFICQVSINLSSRILKNK